MTSASHFSEERRRQLEAKNAQILLWRAFSALAAGFSRRSL
jgi:hypothetical protein